MHAGYGARAALRGVDLVVERRECVALVGPNGSGKTTLLRTLAGVLAPSAGTVMLDGRDIARVDRRERARRIAVVPQSFVLPFAFTAREVASLGRTPHVGFFGGLSRNDRETVDRALEEVDALTLADRAFAELSGGERQRVLLAMALAQDGAVLLLDEPTTHLDIAHELRTLELVRGLAASRGITVIAVLHDLAVAASHFDRLVVLGHGAVEADGFASEVLTSALLANVFGVRARVYWHDGVAAIVPEVPMTHAGRSAS
ncbi:MAG: hypothetical protein AUH85_09580 [Chloroflexi bacterium 13_1_40CM_4_68_4]|nr:MAG: hypothetical protein AUH85_09580 [Chloroflexi bacterium 13_1_40CM_4_68_4]